MLGSLSHVNPEENEIEKIEHLSAVSRSWSPAEPRKHAGPAMKIPRKASDVLLRTVLRAGLRCGRPSYKWLSFAQVVVLRTSGCSGPVQSHPSRLLFRDVLIRLESGPRRRGGNLFRHA